MDSNQKAIDQLIRGMQYLIDQAKKEDTKIYDGVVISASSGGKWNIKYNNKTHAVSSYGNSTPTANSVVKVIVPQGNQNLAWFFIPGSSGGGSGGGATFIPSVSEAGVISWTNDKGLPNPSPVNIKGPQGIQGIQGVPGQQGEQGIPGEPGQTGPYFTPSVDTEGNLSWTNNGSLQNPTTVNIRGPQGIQGETGTTGAPGSPGAKGDPGEAATITIGTVTSGETPSVTNSGTPNAAILDFVLQRGPQGIPGQQGIPGNDATINGQNTINIIAGENIDLQQSGGNLIISSTSSASGLFSTSFSGTLLSSGWVGSGTSYTQSISVSGLTTNSTPVVIPQWGGNKDQEELEWSNLSSTVESISGQLLFTSTQPTTVNINFIVYF